MNIPHTRVALRTTGFVLVGAVDALWIGPVYAAAESVPIFRGPQGAIVMVAVALTLSILGVVCWLAAFAMCVVDGTPAPVDAVRRRAHLAWVTLRTLAQWAMTLVAAPVACIAALTLLIAW